MKIKKFEAAEISEALRAIRDELGPDAVILSTRDIVIPGRNISQKRRVEVTAAVEFTPAAPAGISVEQSKFDQIFKELIPKMEKGEEIFSIREELKSIKESILALQHSPRLESNQFYGRLYDVCHDLKKVSIETEQKSEQTELHECGIRLYDRLVLSGVDHQTAFGLVGLMDKKVFPSENEKDNFYKSYLEKVIQGMVTTLSTLSEAEEKPSLTLLVGPAGVGKTTTLVKLASQKVLKNQSAWMVTLDTSRVGALDQLHSFGKMIGVPVYAAYSVGELKSMISKRKKGEFVFIDTPGESKGCQGRLAELGQLKSEGMPLTTHLVLSAHTREEELDEMSSRYSTVPVDQFIFTKTDETKRFGHLLSMMRKNKRSISYLTMGGRIPDDIEAATPKRVAELVLN
jgi:flagellar biosynthesis protein FlhF